MTAAERSTARASSANLTRRYLTHAELLMLARATGRFETLTLVLGYCGLRRVYGSVRLLPCGASMWGIAC
ncbi:phage integrase family protein [Mycobacterium tuberculosis EAI5/NITR206]|nr:phage integrase family protein [Mycobacterium tuberculosis EAI5/NITR206]